LPFHTLVDRSLMLVTALNPVIGYDKASAIAHRALARHDAEGGSPQDRLARRANVRRRRRSAKNGASVLTSELVAGARSSASVAKTLDGARGF
jgi:hypothetical protein